MISICIPTYNGEKYLPETLDSIFAQNLRDIEILVCDDQSSDGTVAIVKKYAKKHPEIRLIKNKKNLGLVANWNNCIRKAKGNWIKFLFQDDLIETGAIKWFYKAATTQKSKLVISARSFEINKSADPRIVKFFREKLIKLDDFIDITTKIAPHQVAQFCLDHLDNNFIGEPTCYFFHKSLIDTYGYFNEDLDQLCDYEWALRVALNEGMTFIPAPLVKFRIHGGAASTGNKDEAKRFKVEIIDRLLLIKEYMTNQHFKKIGRSQQLEKLRKIYLNRMERQDFISDTEKKIQLKKYGLLEMV